jgi:type II secretion system protein G
MEFKKLRGFTLIELLVVVSIIGILASVVLASLNTARARGRDARRLSDIHQIENALELYFNSNNSYPLSNVPLSAAGTLPNTSWRNSIYPASWTLLETDLSSYIAQLPHDPKESPSGWPGSGAAGVYGYAYFGCGSGYFLVYQLEIASGPDPGTTSCGAAHQYGGAGSSTAIKTVTIN